MVSFSPTRALRRPLRVARARARQGLDRFFERRYGVSTADFLYLEDFGLPVENRLWHDPSDWLATRRALSRLHIGPDDVFVDYGSGLGRAVIVAALFPFRRVIGVELSTEMNERARANLNHVRDRIRAGAVELVTSDAVEWEIPPDLTIAYFYCPFTGEIFDSVIQKLFASVDEHPRPLRIVYNYPAEHSSLIRSGRVHVLDVVSSKWPPRSRKRSRVIVTYLVLPVSPELRRDYLARFPQRVRGAEVWLGEYEPGYTFSKPDRLGGIALERPPVSHDRDAR